MQPEHNILIVDGSADDRRRVRETLARIAPGLTCYEAVDLNSALQTLSEVTITIVIVDHLFPGGSALELLRRQVDSSWAAAAVVVVSSADSDPLALRLIEAGAQDFLVKSQTDAKSLRRALVFAVRRKKAAMDQLEGSGQARRIQQLGAIGRLARGVAHEFNNILMVVMGLAEMLYLEAPEGAETRDDLLEILDAGRRGQKLTRQLLAFGRTDMSRPMVLDMERLVLDSKKLVDELVPENIELVVEVGTGPHLVRGDHSQLQQLLMDLCMSSAQGMPDGGDVCVSLEHWSSDDEQQLPQVILSVRDSGPAFDEETCERIFEPFFAPPGRKRSGLGLAPVYGVARQHGGHIEVDSVDGQGTCFRVYLPAAEAIGKLPEPNERGVVSTGGRPTVLLVEDEESVRRVAERWLSAQGYHVVTACDGMDGLERYQALRGAVDLLVTDCQMPRLRGEELASRLREHRADLPVVLMTGYVETATLQDLFGAGNVYFLRKPFSGEKLVDAAASLLGA